MKIRTSLLVLVISVFAGTGAAGLFWAYTHKTPAPTMVVPDADSQTDIVMGREDAPLTVIEYSALTCSHCATFHKETLPLIKKHYIDTGRVRMVFRHYPIDRQALQASAVVSQLPQVRQPQAIDALFDQQEKWVQTEDGKAIAKICGLPEDTCTRAMNDPAVLDGVLAQRAAIEKEFKISGTPTFIINGVVYPEALTFDEFENIVNGVELPAKH